VIKNYSNYYNLYKKIIIKSMINKYHKNSINNVYIYNQLYNLTNILMIQQYNKKVYNKKSK